jgi:hypothetical protein
LPGVHIAGVGACSISGRETTTQGSCVSRFRNPAIVGRLGLNLKW